MIQLGEDIVSAATAYVASQGFPNASYLSERGMLVVPAPAGVTHFVQLSGLAQMWRDADQISRRRLLERRLLALRRSPEKVTDELLADRLLPRLRSLAHLQSLTMQRQIIERVDNEQAPEITLPHEKLNGELGIQLVFELSEESADVNDARVAAWGRPFSALMKMALQHLRERSTAPMHQLKPRLWASTIGDGHDAARLLLQDRLDATKIKGEMVVMAPHYDLLLACSADDETALAEMARFGLQASQQPFGLPGVAMKRGADGWTPWLPSASSDVFEPLRMARLPGVSRAYARQKELLEAWFDLEGENKLVAPMIILEEGDRLYSGAVWLKGASSLLPLAERVAFAIPDQGDNARVYPVEWEVALKLPGIHVERLPELSPVRYRATGFPDMKALESAAAQLRGR